MRKGIYLRVCLKNQNGEFEGLFEALEPVKIFWFLSVFLVQIQSGCPIKSIFKHTLVGLKHHCLVPQGPEIHGRDRRNTLFGHINAINHVHSRHRRLVVRDDDELRILREAADDVVELLDVGIVQRRVHLIEDAKRRGLQ